MKINKILLFCLSGLLIVGCEPKKQSINYTYVATSEIPAETDRGDAQTQIAEASTAIGHSLRELSAIQIATNPDAPVPILDVRRIGMTQIVSVNWNGPVEPLLHRIAELGHYKVRIIGQIPAIPVLVAVDAHNRMLGEILQDTIYQAHTQADIVVDPYHRVIELRYHEP